MSDELMIRTVDFDPKYDKLFEVLVAAFRQAEGGKGKERHATGEPFEDQICCYMLRHTGIGGAVFQVCKKAIEAQRLPYPANVNELRGAINYAAAAIIELERQNSPDVEEGRRQEEFAKGFIGGLPVVPSSVSISFL